MSLIECPECHKEISDKAEKCPNCGCPLKHKTKLYLIIIAAVCSIIAILVLISAFGDFRNFASHNNNDIIVGKYYVGVLSSAVVIRFNDDGSVEYIDCGAGREQDKRIKYSGTYKIDDAKLVIDISGQKELDSVIHKDGDSITIEGKEFNQTSKGKISSKTLDMFE